MPGIRKRMTVKQPETEEPNEYELWIRKQRAETKMIMNSLREEVVKVAPPPPKQAPKKRKSRASSRPSEPLRKSARVANKPERFIELEIFSDDEVESGRGRKRSKTSTAKRISSPSSGADSEEEKSPKVNGRVFGHISNVPIGTHWEKRDACGRAGVHPPTVAGIFGSGDAGAYSVAVSAGYPEDVDLGDKFTYTGSGGRELKKKNLRTAPQSSDQKLERGNLALWKSAQTGNPVRVIRGFKAKLGPVTGYRYDGLYEVTKAYEAKNVDGKFKVWKFDFVRIKGQEKVDYAEKERAAKEESEAEEESEDEE